MPSFGIFAQKVKRGGSAGRRLPSGDAIGERAHPQNKVAQRELQAMTEHLQDYKQYAHRNYRQDRASTSTTNLPWALKRANDLWNAIEEDHEEMARKRMKASKTGGA